MAKIAGPLFSLGASGTVAGLLTFNPTNTHTTARRSPRSNAPPTTPQTYYRSQLAAAAQSWRALDAAKKLEWAAIAAPLPTTTFAKYFLEWMAQHSTPQQPPYLPMA